MTPELQKLLAGGFLIVRILVKEILFNIKESFPEAKYWSGSEANSKALGACIYHVYTDMFRDLIQTNESNIDEVTLNDKPEPISEALGYESDGGEHDNNNMINGVPEEGSFQFDKEALTSSMEEALTNLLDFINLQSGDERLPVYKNKFDLRKAVAEKTKKIDGELSGLLTDYIQEKERMLKIN